MYIHADMRGSGTLLLALDGVPVGFVVEADTSEGWVRRYDTTKADLRLPGTPAEMAEPDAIQTKQDMQSRLLSCPIVRVEGKVDFIGDTATDPDWMIAQRLAAIRIRHGLPIDVSVAHDTSGVVASVLERLASKLRSGSMVATHVGQARDAESFPLPNDQVQFHPTGRMHVSVDYESPDDVRVYEEAKAAWSREHPDLVPAYIRRCTEGEAKIVEDVETNIDHRVRSARIHSQIRK